MQITCIPQSSTNTILISIEKLITNVRGFPVKDLTGWSPSSIYGEFLRVINSKETDDLVCHYTMPASQLIALCDHYNQVNPDFNQPPTQPQRDDSSDGIDKTFKDLDKIGNDIQEISEDEEVQGVIESYNEVTSLAYDIASINSQLDTYLAVLDPAKHPAIIEIFTKLNHIRDYNTPRPIVRSRNPLSFFWCCSDNRPRTPRESSPLLENDNEMSFSRCQLL